MTSALHTDLYQLSMACGYFRAGVHRDEAAFHLFFRSNPFNGGYALAAGIEPAMQYLENFRFQIDELDYLSGLVGNDDRPLFDEAFLAYLGELRLGLNVDAVAEGTVVFPHEPMLRVRGSILEAQLVETALLNIVNFQTLVATKAARICQAAGSDVIEFGLRRAQGPDGGLSASRAAYVGGCAGTSNVLAGKEFGIPVVGTHAHSWVMFFDSEPEAFQAWATHMPNNAVFLVDTYDTIEGVRRAIEVARDLQANGHRFAGIRLDSGDLAWLSKNARQMMDEAGFTQARIVASNDLDEYVIESLRNQNAKIDVWGVGTKLATAFDQPALGGVYKLAASRREGQPWEHRIKLSEQAVKINIPGHLNVRRYFDAGRAAGDMIYDELTPVTRDEIVDAGDHTRRKDLSGLTSVKLLEPFLVDGARVRPPQPLDKVRAQARESLSHFHEGTRRFLYPHEYPVGLEPSLHNLRTELILRARSTEEL